jgi:N-acetylglucosaminyldiphosphoundecaprenol N-acetyl-beta-D-mannosaminyltransferase
VNSPNSSVHERADFLGITEIPQHDLMGIKVSTPSMSQLLGVIEASLASRRRTTVTFLNPNYAVAACRDDSLRTIIGEFDLDLVDGWGIALAAPWFGFRVPERLANDDIGAELFALLAARGSRVFLFGSAPGVADAAAATLRRHVPGIQIVGTHHGWVDVERGHPGRFERADLDAIVDAINAARADFVLVGLPTPHQQRFVIEYRDRLRAPLIMTGGSYLDHLTDRIEWYPAWVKRLRICWLYRLAREPRRLWYRYTIEPLLFGLEIYRYLLGSRRRSDGGKRSLEASLSRRARR